MMTILQFERALHGVKDVNGLHREDHHTRRPGSLNRKMNVMTKYRIFAIQL